MGSVPRREAGYQELPKTGRFHDPDLRQSPEGAPAGSSCFLHRRSQSRMNLTVQFSKMPNGPNHVSSMVIDGVSKQLNVATQNSNYQHL